MPSFESSEQISDPTNAVVLSNIATRPSTSSESYSSVSSSKNSSSVDKSKLASLMANEMEIKLDITAEVEVFFS